MRNVALFAEGFFYLFLEVGGGRGRGRRFVVQGEEVGSS